MLWARNRLSPADRHHRDEHNISNINKNNNYINTSAAIYKQLRFYVNPRLYFNYRIDERGHRRVAGKMLWFMDYDFPELRTIGATSLCFRPPDLTVSKWREKYKINKYYDKINILTPTNEAHIPRPPCECVRRQEQHDSLNERHTVTNYIDDSSSVIGFKS